MPHERGLSRTRDEIVEAGKIFGAKRVELLGGDATEAAFKAAPLDQFRIIHIAAHGIASAKFPERSALVLGEDPKKQEDGLLQTREIWNLILTLTSSRYQRAIREPADYRVRRALRASNVHSCRRAQGPCSPASGPPAIRPPWPSWNTSTVIWLTAETKVQLFNKQSLTSSKNLAARLCRFIGPGSIWWVRPQPQFLLPVSNPGPRKTNGPPA